MPGKPANRPQRTGTAHGLKRPTVGGLLGHILHATLSGAALTLLLGGAALLVVLDYHGIPATHYLALLPVMVALLALVRGGKAWQADLDNYQKALAHARHGHGPRH